MNKVNALRGCFVFCAMPFMLVAALASSSELRHRRHCAATKSMLVVVVAPAGIVWHATRMLAAPSRLRIAEPDSMHHVRMQVMFAHSGACDPANLAVLYGCQRALLLCSLSGAGRLSGKKLSIFFFSSPSVDPSHFSLVCRKQSDRIDRYGAKTVVQSYQVLE